MDIGYVCAVTLTLEDLTLDQHHDIPYNGYFLRLEIFAIWTPKHNILIFAFLIFAIPFNRKNY